MVSIVMVGSSPEGEEVAQAPGKIVAAVSVDGLEQSTDNPQVHGEEMEISGQRNPDDGSSDRSKGEKHNLNGRGVLGGQTERSGVGMVQLVDHLVKRAVMQSPVEPVMPGILHDEEKGNMEGHLANRREGDAEAHAEVGRDGVEEPDLRELDGEVAKENQAGTFPLLFHCRYFLLL